jgi:hypothetical protein
MTVELSMRDGRLLARLINLAHQFDCTFNAIAAYDRGDDYSARIRFSGSDDALSRLEKKIPAIIRLEGGTLYEII